MTNPSPKSPPVSRSSKQVTKSEAIKKIVRVVRQHRLSYDAFIAFCQQVRLELKMEKPKKERRLPELLWLAELKKFYPAVRVSELVNIRVSDIDPEFGPDQVQTGAALVDLAKYYERLGLLDAANDCDDRIHGILENYLLEKSGAT
jgi:hypothetical protein